MRRIRRGQKTTSAKRASYNGAKKGVATDTQSRGGNIKSGGVVTGIDKTGKKFTINTRDQKRDALTGRYTWDLSSKVKDIAKKKGVETPKGEKAATQKESTLAAEVSKSRLKSQLQKKLSEIKANKEPFEEKPEAKGNQKDVETKPENEKVIETDDGFSGKESKQPKPTSVEARFAEDSFKALKYQLDNDNLPSEQKATINSALAKIIDDTEKSIIIQLLFRDQSTKANQRLADRVRQKILQGEVENLLTERQMVSLRASMIKQFGAGKLPKEVNKGITGSAVRKVDAANKKLKEKKGKTVKDVKKAVGDSGAKKAKDIAERTPKRPKKIKKQGKGLETKATPPLPKPIDSKRYDGSVLFRSREESDAYIEDYVKDVKLNRKNQLFVEGTGLPASLVKLGQKLGYNFKISYDEYEGVGGYHDKINKILAITPEGLSSGFNKLNIIEHELIHALQFSGQGAEMTKGGFLKPVGVDFTRVLTPRQAARYMASYEKGENVPYELEAYAGSELGGNRVLATALKISNEGVRSNKNKTNVEWWIELSAEMNDDLRFKRALKAAAESYPELNDLYKRKYSLIPPEQQAKDFKELDDETLGKAVAGITSTYTSVDDDSGDKNTARRKSVEKGLKTYATAANKRTLKAIMDDGQDLYDMLDEAVDSINGKLSANKPFSLSSLTNLIRDLNRARFNVITNPDATFEQQEAISFASQRAKVALYNIWVIADDEQKAQLLKQSGLTLENLNTFTGGVLEYDA